jgi:hypothetical protein
MILKSLWRIMMKAVALLVVLCTFFGPAIAQASECQSITKSSDRLACYDKAAAPAARVKPSAAAPAPAASTGQAGDLLAEENARLDAKIKNICRGC